MCQPQPRVGSGRAHAKERPTPRRGPKSALQSPGEPLPQPLPPQHRQHRHPAAGQGRCCDGAIADRQTHATPKSGYENGLRIDVEICPKQQDTAFNLLIKTLEFSPPDVRVPLPESRCWVLSTSSSPSSLKETPRRWERGTDLQKAPGNGKCQQVGRGLCPRARLCPRLLQRAGPPAKAAQASWLGTCSDSS